MLLINMDIQIQLVNTADLKEADYNPRELAPTERRQLVESIKKFGFAEPIVVNSNPERKNIIVGGRQRWDVAKEIGLPQVPVVYLNLNLEQERELNLRLNRDYGAWDLKKLADFDYKLLKDVGFKDGELKKITEVLDINHNPEIPFTPELLEEQNYVLFYFNNSLDWNVIKEFFKIAPAQALDSREGYERVGIGRVLDGHKLLTLIKNNEIK